MSSGKCFICGRYETEYNPLEVHHIFGGANRKLSEKYGLTVLLCHNCHNEPPDGVHFNPEIMQNLHEVGQRAAMLLYDWSVEDFRKIFGKSYI